MLENTKRMSIGDGSPDTFYIKTKTGRARICFVTRYPRSADFLHSQRTDFCPLQKTSEKDFANKGTYTSYILSFAKSVKRAM